MVRHREQPGALGVAYRFNLYCCRLASLFPRVAVNILLAWASYVLIFSIILHSYSGFAAILLVGLSASIYCLCVAAYFLTVRYGSIGPARQISTEDEVHLESGTASLLLNNVQAKENGQKRYCGKCKNWKPDRTHHCSTCQTCVLKMDHHCPWFSICIGYENHKYFVLFLTYVVADCVVTFFISGIALLDWIDKGEYEDEFISLNWVLVFIISAVFGIAVSVFWGYQLYLLFSNKTTIEAMETQRYNSQLSHAQFRYSEAPSSETVGNVFDLGWKENFRQVMGDHAWQWVLPIRSSKGTGLTFQTNAKVMAAIRNQADQEAQMLSNLNGFLERNSTSNGGQQNNVVVASEEDEYNGRVSVEFRPSDWHR
ncbi:DHHC palmitoyltransferase-domain-containing protein [Lipomyces japonicus]|uniref:DHHC palmitoyltransferase-domain-containing protein n=1 Tax=Lipomyces japonicus TaxID=56871 RepID=UPI0034CD0694